MKLMPSRSARPLPSLLFAAFMSLKNSRRQRRRRLGTELLEMGTDGVGGCKGSLAA